MKHIYAVLAFLALGIAACAHGQHPPSATQYTCPTAGSGVYVDLNAVGGSNPPTTAMTYTDAPPVGAQECYVVQGYLSGPGYGLQSNVAGPIDGGPTGHITLTWTCTPGTGTTCLNVLWVAQRVAAVAMTAPATPTMGAPTTSQVVKPALPDTTLAMIGKLELTAQAK